MEDKQLVAAVQESMQLRVSQDCTHEQFMNELELYINQLILLDFDLLVRLLYRIDVSEKKLMQLLQQHPQQDAGKLIAALIVERQLQKINARKNNQPPAGDADVAERW